MHLPESWPAYLLYVYDVVTFTTWSGEQMLPKSLHAQSVLHRPSNGQVFTPSSF